MKIILVSLMVIIGVSLTLVADILLKRSAFQNIQLLALGLILYALVAFPVAITFKFTEFGLLFIVWEAATIALGLVVATFFFGEPFTIQKFVAFLLIIVALVLTYTS